MADSVLGQQWPLPPSDLKGVDIELRKIEYQGQVDAELARLQAKLADELETLKRTFDAEVAREQQIAAQLTERWSREAARALREDDRSKTVHDARVEIAKTSIARARSGADFVRNVSAALVALYTGIAGLTFAATDKPLPPRGMVPGVFLGAAVVLAAASVAWLGRVAASPAPVPHSSLHRYEEARLNAFTRWSADTALGRSYLLHTAVLSLGAGVVALPLPFLDVGDVAGWLFLGIGVVALAGFAWARGRTVGGRKPPSYFLPKK